MRVTHFPGLGASTLVPRPREDFRGSDLDAFSGFILSRVDGKTTIGDICLLVPCEAVVTAEVLRHLWKVGAIELPGSPEAPELDTPMPPPGGAFPEKAPPEPVASGACDLTPQQIRRIEEVYASLGERDAFELLEVARSADKRDLKRAYHRLSKEFHPDRFFGKNLGGYGARMSSIFQAVKAAFELLSDDGQRAAYEHSFPAKS